MSLLVQQASWQPYPGELFRVSRSRPHEPGRARVDRPHHGRQDALAVTANFSTSAASALLGGRHGADVTAAGLDRELPRERT